MTQEDKELLLKDLCARLPYCCRVFSEYVDDLGNKTYEYSLALNTWCIAEFKADKAIVKPYLRPMSSMTEDEREILRHMDGFLQIDVRCNVIDGDYSVFDYLNSIHIDYRGLIPMGLAIEVTKDNNPYK